MRRPHRNIEIFSMSVLDMFASALGAFIMCSIILFPFFKKDLNKEIKTTQEQVERKNKAQAALEKSIETLDELIKRQASAVQQVRNTRASLESCKQGVNQCQVALAKNFLLVKLEWNSKNTSVNLDLHVTDSDGNEFYWRKTNKFGQDFPEHPTKARLSVESEGGCISSDRCVGIELWMDPEAKAGTYKIDYVVEDAIIAEASVSGVVIDRLGTHPLKERTFQPQPRGLRLQAAVVSVDAVGKLSLEREAP